MASPPKKGSVYFIGIGGIGMSALARYFKAGGYVVSGSDGARSGITDALKKEGIAVAIGHHVGNLKKINPGNSFIIYNRAIPLNNPELVDAEKRDIPALPYAEVLGKVTEQYATIAITGSHGKSTTTALAALVLAAAGFDPTVLVGTNLREFGGRNIRIGNSPYLVLEADDFGAAFLWYSPAVAIVTNVDREHMDFYKTFARVKHSFLEFIARTRDGGVLILNRDDAPLRALAPRIRAIATAKQLRVVWYSAKAAGKSAAAIKKIRSVMQIPGEHNVSNAAAVFALGTLLKINEKKILGALGAYRGSWRRMEYRGKFTLPNSPRAAISVFDDYAHHPTEIRATLQAFRAKFPRQSIICVFQPHQAKRLKVLFREFVSAFTDADFLIVIPSYTVAGRDEADSKFTSERLTRAIARKYSDKKVYYLADPRNIKKLLKTIVPGKPAVLLMMGAGDIVNYTPRLF